MPSIAKRTSICDFCGEKGRYRIWGTWYCRDCYFKKYGKYPEDVAEERGKGHSGMLALPEAELNRRLQQTYFHPQSFKYPCLVRVPKGDKVFASLYLSHYPESLGIVGRSSCYLIIYQQRLVGIIGANSPPYSVKPIDKFFGITKENRTELLCSIMNNEVFRIIRPAKNLATMTLKTFRRQMKREYDEKYNEKLVGLLTFVEPPRTGAIYKADNWAFLGMTKGFGTTRRGKSWHDRKWVKRKPKLIFAYKYR